MGRVVVSEFVSVDGVFEDPGGSEGTPNGGWQRELMGDDESTFKFDELKQADALMLGRKTYEGFAAAWPTMQDAGEFGELMNGLPKHVATLSLNEFTWNNSQALDPQILTAVTKLKEQYTRDILVYGSATLLASLLEGNLVDELRLLTYPIVLGQGRKLFDGVSRTSLRLVETRQFERGTVLLTYSQTKED